MEIEKIKTGDFVIIKEEADIASGYFKIAKTNGFPLVVYGILPDSLHVYTKDIAVNEYASNPFIINRDLVIPISKEDFDIRVKNINEDFYKKIKKKVEKLKSARIAISDRKDYFIKNRDYLDTNLNFCMVISSGLLEKNNFDVTKLLPEQKQKAYVAASCCSFSRTPEDILIYIPKIWLNYFGYNLIDLKSWFNFLEGCEIEFNGIILGERTLEEAFGSRANEYIRMNSDNRNIYYSKKEECYEVFLKGDKHSWITYLRFILIRFLYSSMYWNIPLIAMKLKKNLPKLTNWECLLIAHCNENYDSYYSLIGNTESSGALPSKGNSQKMVLDRLKQISVSMNRSFVKYTEDITILRKAIREEKYETIEELVNKYRNVN